MQNNKVGHQSLYNTKQAANLQTRRTFFKSSKWRNWKTMVRSSLGSLELIVTNLGEVLVCRDMLP